MELDARMLLSIGGTLCSVAAAAAIVRVKLASATDALKDIEKRLRGMDRRLDTLDTTAEIQQQRTKVLSEMSSPENLRRDHMSMARLIRECEQLRKEVDHLVHIHNSKHIPVSDVRKAD
tara:strand:- start:75 stop:431 length:357 start_codon:yes stop_codon:yes gene_type:complete